jgi:hypothetical protein
MVIIKTKYIPVTNSRPKSRVRAMMNNLSITINYDGSKGTLNAHFNAVIALVKKHGLSISEKDLESMAYGSDNTVYYFAFADSTVKDGIKNGY